MNYYKVMYDYEHDENLMYLEIDELQLKLNRYEYEKRCILEEEYIFCYVKNINGYSDYIANNLSWLIVSEKCKKIIENNAVGEIVFIPVIDNDSKKIIGYLVHTMNFLDAFNEDKALCKRIKYQRNGEEKEYISVIKYAILKSVVASEDSDLFKLAGHLSPFFISDKLKKQFEDNNLVGFDYQKIKVI